MTLTSTARPVPHSAERIPTLRASLVESHADSESEEEPRHRKPFSVWLADARADALSPWHHDACELAGIKTSAPVLS